MTNDFLILHSLNLLLFAFSMPIVCTTRFNAVGAISRCIDPEACSSSSSSDRRRALLILNNLCIPVENKAAILLNPKPLQQLIPALLKLLRKRVPESYLAMVCLYNLSFLQDAKLLFFSFVPAVEQNDNNEGLESYRQYAPTDNPISLLRTVESAMKEFIPYLVQLQEQQALGGSGSIRSRSFRLTDSVEWEVIRFGMGMFRNLVTKKENAIVAATETVLPTLAIQSLQVSNRDLSLWSRDSLEDASLMLLVHLAQHDECIKSLQQNIWNDETRQVLQSLHGKGGIHETRAMALLRLLERGHKPTKRKKNQYSIPLSLVQDEKKDY